MDFSRRHKLGDDGPDAGLARSRAQFNIRCTGPLRGATADLQASIDASGGHDEFALHIHRGLVRSHFSRLDSLVKGRFGPAG